MGADGFEVNYEQLGKLAQTLANLRGEFKDGDDAIGPLMNTISNGDLKGKLHDFTSNWSDRKKDILKEIDQAAGFAKSAADAYRQTDEGQADGWAKAAEGTVPAPAGS